jgi:hypothetical protein
MMGGSKMARCKAPKTMQRDTPAACCGVSEQITEMPFPEFLNSSARNFKFRGLRRTLAYAAGTRDEGNEADGRFGRPVPLSGAPRQGMNLT